MRQDGRVGVRRSATEKGGDKSESGANISTDSGFVLLIILFSSCCTSSSRLEIFALESRWMVD